MARRGCPLFYCSCFYTKTPVPAILTLKKRIYFPISYTAAKILSYTSFIYLKKGDYYEAKHQKNLKKVLSTVLVSVFITGLAFASPSKTLTANAAKPNMKKVVDLYAKKKYKKAEKLAKKLPKTANEKAVRKMSSKMKKAYLKKVKAYRKNNDIFSYSEPYLWDYYLSDIDKNGIPELLLRYGTCEADVKLLVFTYKKGKAVKIGETSCGHSAFYAYPNENGLIMREAHMSYEYVHKLSISNGKLKITEIQFGRFNYSDLK